jgi:hypothetical protein
MEQAMNIGRPRLFVLTSILLFSFFLSGCGPSTEVQDAASVLQSPTSTTAFPTGEFYMPLTEDPRAPFVWLADGVYFIFNEDGTFTITDTIGVQRMAGTYIIDGNLYTETSTDMLSCQRVGPATYKWIFNGEYLGFVDAGDDDCKARKALMDGRFLIIQD